MLLKFKGQCQGGYKYNQLLSIQKQQSLRKERIIKRDFAMKKKQEKRIVEKPATLGDLLNKDLVNELKEKKKELENQEAQKIQAQEEKKREE